MSSSLERALKGSADEYYIPPPQLPGVVSRFPVLPHHLRISRRMAIFLCAFVAFGLVQMLIEVPDKAIVLFIFGLIVFFQISSRVSEVQLTYEFAIIKYGLGKRKQHTALVQDCFVLIYRPDRASRYTGKHYAYAVWLVPKGFLEEEVEDGSIFSYLKINKSFSPQVNVFQGAGALRKIGAIRISPDIYTPDNVKEYIDSIQLQFSESLPVVFGSEQIALDYATGTYEAKVLDKDT